MAAAYHHRDRLIGGVVNTKDADVVIQPAGAVAECEAIAGEFADSQFDGLGERLTHESGAADNQSLC